MADDRPEYSDYPAWLRAAHGVALDQRLKNRYEAIAGTIRTSFAASPFWMRLPSELREFDAEYQVETGYALLYTAQMPELLVKPFSSYVEKTYRKNILQNPAWPDPPPPTGWLLPPNVVSVNDVVRTCLIVKYLDGPAFLTERLETLARDENLDFWTDFEAREEGYYAAHAYLQREFEVPAEQWDTETVTASIELQVTTQVQEVIRRLLHRYYETRRALTVTGIATKWQWDYSSDEFSANYLGHILHYVEGMIMEVRERQARETA